MAPLDTTQPRLDGGEGLLRQRPGVLRYRRGTTDVEGDDAALGRVLVSSGLLLPLRGRWLERRF